ncbi:hypothetical protein ACVWZ4_003107 [Bradyrhizobium sp. USDA 4472]
MGAFPPPLWGRVREGGWPQRDCPCEPPSPTPPHKGEGSPTSVLASLHYCIEIGEKSMNQLFGWITPVTFGLMARGPTSWAT